MGRARKLLQKVDGAIGPKQIAQVLKDHIEYPSSICRHDNPKIDPGLSMGTVFSMIANLTSGEILFCKGNPCEQGYETYQIDFDI